ncbi:MAG: tRNA (N(6)-L-threonylcarbamoyladenosine(37)-C(2))-methylthiotransferase MtaB [Rhizobiales bacterium]|nr:tRNA (N(6)-L-threonylcarbamoyladenosine(37)-C(2))-methylthiotransferase MtaB [Hyphomicrobiales bacterium]MBO6699843.1 tRNA (N(6)-L-threonylcarbamoyladenosine(37)-C(2))-methylthiotransferase MtaB [Hyphomicrobiales bacterium]MBO6737381.1 tRNA (N(6)-L-threonylcarbamoyladenosine(37)-C(2))-methylthiotransferase MtaB [Hyphomicrobiales bacterium]MBO6911545.1 tRNA (N(6)-L-threonylcarbamoyladenosine(37)-C(2))-methylthiotransferase MtaB [Hyphomicrobiales bacterium]MBO6955155.1 tRNA (N(6)-L-threonylcar
MAVDVLTLGCRLNTVESEAMRQSAEAAGHSNTIIVNTCAVTSEAVRQARQTIRKAKRDNPTARVVVTGCAAQIEPETFAHMDEVDLVLGNEAKTAPATWATLPAATPDKLHITDIMRVKETSPAFTNGFGERTRAFVEVQNGCDHRCTFCIIPNGRGNARSVPMGVAVDQIKRLVDQGYAEAVLTGVDLTSYGPDLPGSPKLGDLVQQILRHVPELQRLRLSSIDSIEADPALVDAIKGDERLMPHLHLSLQAGDDMILKRMKRRHLRDDAIAFCQDMRAARPDIVYGADIIAGFPTETEAMFENSLKLVDECGLTFLHVFPFSPRQGTPAAKMPQVDRPTIKARADRLREKGREALAKHLASQAGTTQPVLIERVADGLARGRIPAYTEVAIPVTGNGPAAGDILPVAITGHEGQRLTGSLTNETDQAA